MNELPKPTGARAVPVEVKSGTNLKAKSLAASIKRFGYDLAIRFSAGKPSRDGAIIDLPLYAVESLPKLRPNDCIKFEALGPSW